LKRLKLSLSCVMDGNSLSKSNRTVAIIQARMGSSRLPGKMMMDLCGQPVLHWVLSRVKKIKLADSILLATTDTKKDDPLEELAQDLNVPVFRGSETDVLGRFIAAAQMAKADSVVRICGDNPLISPEEIDRLISFFEKTMKEENTSDNLYAFNFASKLGNQYPDGLGAEILSLSLLEKISRLDDQPSSREHVTKYIWDHPEQFLIRTFPAPEELAYPSVKLDVDSQEDLEKLNILCAHLDQDSSPKKIINVYRVQFSL
jgi:spore coat polysaccharide biosynthesis protein SpsF